MAKRGTKPSKKLVQRGSNRGIELKISDLDLLKFFLSNCSCYNNLSHSFKKKKISLLKCFYAFCDLSTIRLIKGEKI
jgi:hypothetical protein